MLVKSSSSVYRSIVSASELEIRRQTMSANISKHEYPYPWAQPDLLRKLSLGCDAPSKPASIGPYALPALRHQPPTGYEESASYTHTHTLPATDEASNV